ncbi:MAG: transglycosylase SLT domain-containing protein [Halieaceae bacterium]|jgi:soluble lytic murein transglycosylase-like protein|uniref:transglycosylase SLT domain-containing protein n=1 Tax=Haliea alexandrii TaxID=2448162 RepID=UPI000F0B54D7|nr:transglycosylase SLT domain-containing protein [Haliea alexandrii]MCR9185846.1 transglycosylase SLT domain-containing protein [Halieaceae bacterium]
MRSRCAGGARGLATAVFALVLALAPGHNVQGQPEDPAEREALRVFLNETINSTHSFQDRYDAEVWLVDMSARLARFINDPEERLLILRQVHSAATRASLPPELVLAVIEVESHFDRFAISRVGAQGMMQVMPFWKNEIGRAEDNLTLNRTNFEYGSRILQFYLKREKGDLHRALAAYNGSLGSRRYSNKVYEAWARRWRTAPLPW